MSELSGIPQFISLLNESLEIHKKKNADYAAPTNKFENFERAAELASWFNNNEDKAFVIMIGTKLARLATLLNSKRAPKNESIHDSFVDLVTYCGLWGAYKKAVWELTIQDFLIEHGYEYNPITRLWTSNPGNMHFYMNPENGAFADTFESIKAQVLQREEYERTHPRG